LNESVDLPCGAAVTGMYIEYKRSPTLWDSCDGHGAGMVTQVVMATVEARVWMAVTRQIKRE